MFFLQTRGEVKKSPHWRGKLGGLEPRSAKESERQAPKPKPKSKDDERPGPRG